MRLFFASIFMILTIAFGCIPNKKGSIDNSGFRNNIKFNHLFVVIDDSTYKYLFDSLKFLKQFAKTSEQTTNAGNEQWTGKYIHGLNNYLEIFRPGGAKGTRFGDVGLGFMTNKFGTIDSLQNYWTKTLDSVHIDNRVIVDSGKIYPWFKLVSIPDMDSLKISLWVMENTKEEMTYAGFTEKDLSKEIGYSDYDRHIKAKLRNIPVDSVRYEKLFDRVTSLNISLSDKELSYLRQFLLDIGFTEKNNSFSKDDFTLTYLISEKEHFLLKKMGFSLLKRMPIEKHSFRNIDMIVDGDKAAIEFKYD